MNPQFDVQNFIQGIEYLTQLDANLRKAYEQLNKEREVFEAIKVQQISDIRVNYDKLHKHAQDLSNQVRTLKDKIVVMETERKTLIDRLGFAENEKKNLAEHCDKLYKQAGTYRSRNDELELKMAKMVKGEQEYKDKLGEAEEKVSTYVDRIEKIIEGRNDREKAIRDQHAIELNEAKMAPKEPEIPAPKKARTEDDGVLCASGFCYASMASKLDDPPNAQVDAIHDWFCNVDESKIVVVDTVFRHESFRNKAEYVTVCGQQLFPGNTVISLNLGRKCCPIPLFCAGCFDPCPEHTHMGKLRKTGYSRNCEACLRESQSVVAILPIYNPKGNKNFGGKIRTVKEHGCWKTV